MRRRLREGGRRKCHCQQQEKKAKNTKRTICVPNLSFHGCVAFGGKNIFVSFGSFFAKKAIKICRSGRKRKKDNLIQGPSSLLLQEILDSIFLPPLPPLPPLLPTSLHPPSFGTPFTNFLPVCVQLSNCRNI